MSAKKYPITPQKQPDRIKKNIIFLKNLKTLVLALYIFLNPEYKIVGNAIKPNQVIIVPKGISIVSIKGFVNNFEPKKINEKLLKNIIKELMKINLRFIFTY